ncbi:MAG: serine/threonine protein kinase, partial [Planctomycetota bacterium]
CADAMRFEQFGDQATAIDKYQSLITLLGDDEAELDQQPSAGENDVGEQTIAPEQSYRPLVNLARYRIAQINASGDDRSEAARLITTRLREADELFEQGRTIAARNIWYSIVQLYGGNAAVAPLVQTAQDRLGETAAGS